MSSAMLVTTLAVAALLVGEARGPRWLPWVSKPVASLGFVLAAFDAAPADLAGWVLVAGLAACLVGDVCLLSRAPRWFLAGLGSFFAGHVLYAIAFGMRGVDVVVAATAAATLAVPAIVVWRWLKPHVEVAMRGAVVAYVVAITVMVAFAVGGAGPRSEWIALAGAFGFYLSDLSVARDVFVQRALVNRLWGLPLYYGAQLCLASIV
jgi:uncharacterized membrane protein YhhN